MFDAISLWQLWLIACALLLIGELLLPSFLLACFAFGAIFSSLVASLGAGIYWQLGVFALCSLLSIFLLRPLLRRMGRRKEVLSGVDALEGYRFRIEADLSARDLYGEVKIAGDVWRIRSASGVDIKEGELVEVVGREGLVLMIRTVEALSPQPSTSEA